MAKLRTMTFDAVIVGGGGSAFATGFGLGLGLAFILKRLPPLNLFITIPLLDLLFVLDVLKYQTLLYLLLLHKDD